MDGLTLESDHENHGAAPPAHTLSPGKLRQGLGTELQESQAVPVLKNEWRSHWSPSALQTTGLTAC